MKNKFLSFQTTTILIVLVVIATAIGTFIETASSTENAQRLIYGSTWFEIILALLTINLTGSLLQYKSFQWKKISVPLFHLSFVILMFGAFFTRYTGVEGTMMIREGNSTNIVYMSNTDQLELPFEMKLQDFVLDRYPGSNSPSSYSSYVQVDDYERDLAFEYHIFMNHILKYRGWRFFQSSYDEDEKGTILTASRDVIGTPLTYFGYFISMVAMLLSLFLPGTYFRNQLNIIRKGTAILVLTLAIPAISFALNIDQSKIIPKSEAEKFGELVVQGPNGRMKVMNTYNREFMRKIRGKEELDNINSNQAVLSLIAYPEYWSSVPMLKIKKEEIREKLDVGKYVSFADMFTENGQYTLYPHVSKTLMKPDSERSKAEKSMLELDDNLNILHAFLTGDALTIFPVENVENNKWFSSANAVNYATGTEDSLFLQHAFGLYVQGLKTGMQTGDFAEANQYLNAIKAYQKKIGHEVYPKGGKIKAELHYNNTNLFGRVKSAYGIAGLIMLIVFFVFLYRIKSFSKTTHIIFMVIAILIAIVHAYTLGLRWYIGGFIPLSNAYEAMLYISWITIVAGIILGIRQPVALALAYIMAFNLLFVAGHNNGNPAIGNLVPVLNSYWLSIHVAVITASYGLFALVMMISGINLLIYSLMGKKTAKSFIAKTKQTGAMLHVLLTVSIYLLTIGTILGAIWANESWGRYWGWDPKETWALISIFIYAFVAHMRFIPALKDDYWFNLASMWAFSSVLMTFFGVNYFLAGMHSYAGVGEAVVPSWLYMAVGGFILFSWISGIRYFKLKKFIKV